MEKAEIAIFASFVYPDIKTMMLIYQYSKLFKPIKQTQEESLEISKSWSTISHQVLHHERKKQITRA